MWRNAQLGLESYTVSLPPFSSCQKETTKLNPDQNQGEGRSLINLMDGS